MHVYNTTAHFGLFRTVIFYCESHVLYVLLDVGFFCPLVFALLQQE